METVFWTQLLPWVFYLIRMDFENFIIFIISAADYSDRENIVKLLIENGVNVNEKDDRNSTELHRAAVRGNLMFKFFDLIFFFYFSSK